MGLWSVATASTPTGSAGPGCEPLGAGLLAEPVSAVTSLAFVAAAVAIPLAARRPWARAQSNDLVPAVVAPAELVPVGIAPARPRHLGYAALVAGIGVGSVVQHGPNPGWADLAHDAPLVATLAFVAADAAGDLTGRGRTWWWWLLPTLAFVPLILAAPRPADGAQAGVAAVAIALMLARARARRGLRRPIGLAVGALAVGATLGTLSRAGGPLCVPDSIWQGHGAWHALAALALVLLVPALGHSGVSASAPASERSPAVR